MELFKDKAVWKYGFSLTAHEVTVKFATSTKAEAQRWYTKLRRLCEIALYHISKSLTIGVMIRRGTYSKIQIGASVETGAQYTIKSISKKHLAENPHRMVWIYHTMLGKFGK